ncbi:hypothetical protein RRG08_050380 [Elysia crispata]|uniref:Uncharacterized protein n=1 Tax=Elysia crispata TaxID=231223 RepID=A0AAE0YWE1_9GAST|nr:hypothetical protein RRG08_050380 [Elysia crispata]
MFRFINLGERETLPVRSIGALIHNVKECDGEPANQMMANYCGDVVGNGIVRREVDVPAECVGEIVESANVVETGNVSARVVSEIVNSEHFVESGDVPARDVGENVAESIYVLQELLSEDVPASDFGEILGDENVVESGDVPGRDVGEILGDENVVESGDVPGRDVGEILGDENVVESGDVPGRDVGEILGDENVVESGDVPGRDVGENVMESGDVPGRDVGEILGDENVVKFGDVPGRDVGENVMGSGDLPARDVGEIVDGENLVESRAKDVHSSRDEASCAEFSEALTYNEDANASMPQRNAVSKLSKKEEKKQNRQFGKAYVSQKVTAETQPPEKTQKEAQQSDGFAFVKEFLDRLPKMPSHYCRKDSNKMYLKSLFQSFADIYREYLKVCDSEGKPKMSRTVFVAEVKAGNVSLFMPRKDECDLCCEYSQSNVAEDVYNQHRRSEKSLLKEKRVGTRKCIHFLLETIVLDFDKFEEGGIKSINPSKDANVTNICALRYSRDGSLAFKLSFEEEWQAMPMGRRVKLPKYEPPKLYNSRRKIKKSKFDHLQQQKAVLPAEVHHFYDSLPHL